MGLMSWIGVSMGICSGALLVNKLKHLCHIEMCIIGSIPLDVAKTIYNRT